jgi:hypothetical protein
MQNIKKLKMPPGGNFQSMKSLQDYHQNTIFINKINSYLGYHLVQALRNDHEVADDPHQFIGFIKAP